MHRVYTFVSNLMAINIAYKGVQTNSTEPEFKYEVKNHDDASS